MNLLIKCDTPGCSDLHKEKDVAACIILRRCPKDTTNWNAEFYATPLDFPFSFMLTIRMPDDAMGPVFSMNIAPADSAHLYSEILPQIGQVFEALPQHPTIQK